MNYDRRFSPGANPDYSTRTINPHRDSRSQQITPRGGIDSRAQAYSREYPPLRSRSQNNVEQDYGDRFSQPPQFYDNRGLDLSSRSKSLDNREFRGGDDGFYRNDYPSDGVVIPIRREIGRGPQYDYRSSPQNRPREVETYGFDERRPPAGQEVQIPYNRDSREQYARDGRDGRDPRGQYIRDERDVRDSRDMRDGGREPRDNRDFGTLGPGGPRRSFDGRMALGDSPKSHSSKFKDNRRAIEYNQGRFGDEFEREDYGAIQPYRGPPAHIGGASGGASGGYRASSYHRSHHESHGGGHESSFGGGASRAITQQPQVFHPDMRPVRPIQHHRVQCCCFKFVWPPWSYEQAPAPQPIYRNI